ncbi:hypothetical protein FACS189416_6340 [Bacteroidia bacterium]|nr:hypothetical protein FACS189416_6340 [Bacteroidia bacterium]
MNDLALLPAWYAEAGDYVFTDEVPTVDYFSFLPPEIRPQAVPVSRKDFSHSHNAFSRMEAAPWGLSPQSIHLYNDLKERYGLDLDVPLWREDYVTLSGRQTAALCLEEIRRLLPGQTLPPQPLFFSEANEIEAYMHQYPGRYVLKTPFSSSGRGLLWLSESGLSVADTNWIKGALRKQGSVSLEQAWEKKQDMGLEFYVNAEGKVNYEGLSVFHTNEKGAYKGNVLQSQSSLWKQLESYVSPEMLKQVQKAVTQAVEYTYGGCYVGYLGVDMLIYKAGDGSFAIHPCVEVNLRYTMGLVAIRLFEQFLSDNATALFHIQFEARPHQALAYHQEMVATHPIKLTDGKLQKGYLSLCPVTTETHYIAYILAT